jgi:hypothetical protein
LKKAPSAFNHHLKPQQVKQKVLQKKTRIIKSNSFVPELTEMREEKPSNKTLDKCPTLKRKKSVSGTS